MDEDEQGKTPEVEPEENEQPNDQENVEPDKDDDLPEWARKRIEKANKEAASYRTQLRETQEKLKDAKTPEEIQALSAEFAEQLKVKDRELVIAQHQIPEEYHVLVTGDTPEEWEASAALIEKLRGDKTPPAPPETKTPPQGGRKGNEAPSDEDYLAKARRALKRR
ncbi:hypothetical protein [Brevibacterium moorei]|uniref:hypothetical protein n=1 Tax=Brevibacterium moorei TaxID=2968457 RepID=UPI00211CA06E|nr:hypothetical protein [Brevibacterium sp. 68QC2CO]MCQ9385123.1 hypothetical protein [Brevibacterium sp. 68QC2CO]